MPKVHFRTHAELKSIIGKDLITDDNIAVLELVKNSFDAGSKEVKVIFKNIIPWESTKSYKKENDAILLICDKGKGMSQYDIENKWLNIAYSEKKSIKQEYGRTLAGNKGVGRFSCDRLGKILTIYSRQKNQDFIELVIDWRQFEQTDDINLNIQDVSFELNTISEDTFKEKTGLEVFASGTVLKIESLREEWPYEKILSLKRQLERMINPNQAFNSEKFDIILSAQEYIDVEQKKPIYEKINGLVKNQIFEKLNFKATSIQAKVTKDGRYIITILKDRGNNIFTLIEENRFFLLKNIKIHIYYLNPYSKIYFTKQTGIRAIDFGSISLFINGFRIPPYGDYGDDWLGMENRKNQGRNRYLGTREVIGRIEIWDNNDIRLNDEEDNEEFKIISSRSGIVNNEIFNQLTKSTNPYGFYYKIFRRLERFVVEGIKWDSVVEKNASKIEKEVLSPKWDESKEKYVEDSFTRNKRILEVVHNIIDTKKDEIVELKINRQFVENLIEDQAEKIELELSKIAEQLSNKDLTKDQLKSFFSSLTSSQANLNSLTNQYDFPDSELKKEIENKLAEIKDLDSELKKKEEEIKLKEDEARKLAEELAIEKDKNTYLLSTKRSLSDDAKGLIHNVKHTSTRSKQNAQTLYDAFVEDRVRKSQALKLLSAIIHNSDKALKISNLITRANFKANADYQDVNIIKFMEQYLDLYNVMFEDNEIQFSIETRVDAFWKRISILDLSLIIDDLLSNSFKAKAKNVKVVIENENNDLSIIFSDDGDGLPKRFVDNPEVIFDLGVTTTDGSGIGLNYVQTTLAKMKGTINFVGNGQILKGATFKILISKSYK